MLLRLVVALLALGLGISVASASSFQTTDDVAVLSLDFAEEVEDASDATVAVTAAPLTGNRRPLAPPPSVRDPLRYLHLLFVFRPPRASAFD
jgi:hypothetical protein